MGSQFLFTTVYVPPELVPYLESYAYITLLTKVNLIILVTLREHWCLFLTKVPQSVYIKMSQTFG